MILFPFLLNTLRETLYARINQRVDQMYEQGLLDEIKTLLDSGVTAEMQSMQGIGYKEVAEGLRIGLSENEVKELASLYLNGEIETNFSTSGLPEDAKEFSK